ncbi:hypothetical protein DL96DRAFT_1623645 [Flagelloscypha sp. PMI_526]|nr:hypothetical protein DL96DRAFT_1623645 [Flagelloscypha sp. PMI_526]
MVYQFTALRSLELSVRTSEIGKEALLGDLLKSCAPLQRLSLTSPHSLYRILSIITTHHGPSLHSFTFLHTPVGGGAGDSLSLNDMALLKRKCLCLQKLALTTNRGRRLSDSIGGVGQFTSLSNLTLVFPENPYIMDRSGQSFDASSDEESSPRNAFNSWQAAAWSQKPFHPSFAISIFEDIINKGCSYKKLTIKLGDLARSTRAQKFIVGRSSDGELAVTAKGHALPG